MRCKDCVGKITTLLVGKCICGNEKNSVHKYCEKCSEELGKCQVCGKDLVKRKTTPESEMEKIRKIKKKYEDVLLGLPGIVGVGVGASELIVLVNKDADLVEAILAKEIEGVKVTIKEVGDVVAY